MFWGENVNFDPRLFWLCWTAILYNILFQQPELFLTAALRIDPPSSASSVSLLLFVKVNAHPPFFFYDKVTREEKKHRVNKKKHETVEHCVTGRSVNIHMVSRLNRRWVDRENPRYYQGLNLERAATCQTTETSNMLHLCVIISGLQRVCRVFFRCRPHMCVCVSASGKDVCSKTLFSFSMSPSCLPSIWANVVHQINKSICRSGRNAGASHAAAIDSVLHLMLALFVCVCVCSVAPLPRPPRLNMEQRGDRYFSISGGAQIGWLRGHRRPSSNTTAGSRATLLITRYFALIPPTTNSLEKKKKKSVSTVR